MKYNKETYKNVVDEATPKNTMLKNSIFAFLIGGSICVLGEIIKNIFVNMNFEKDEAGVISSVVLVGISALLTGIGWYDKIGKYGGAGTVVPITGFANSVVSPALDYKREGYILGTAANMFKLAGPVLVFGYFASFVAGLLTIVF